MIPLPIRHITLYKHGVGYYERQAKFSGEHVELSFHIDEMNDVLKSLTAIDWGDGKVLGIEFPTPKSQSEQLEGCSIHLGDERSLQDLVISLRGRQVSLLLDQGESIQGTLVGLDAAPEKQPLASALVSILVNDTNQVKTISFTRLLGLDVLDERGAGDLRFFLSTSRTQEQFRQVTIRLTPGEHELSLSYIAPAPTWRVSYRLITDTTTDKKEAALFGWGIFDNRLEEDLEEISLSLVAGMPISFIYDLYNPFLPSRPVVEEEGRVVSGPVDFESSMIRPEVSAAPAAYPSARMARLAEPSPGQMRGKRLAMALEESVEVNIVSKDLGELFQYNIQTPVTVGRGKSAMAPILTAQLEFHKDLLYNGAKVPHHPVATLRMVNLTGLSLERGPVTVLEDSAYLGEAVLPFTPAGKEIVVPYAVELGVKVSETPTHREETHGLHIRAGYLVVENWDIFSHQYQMNNTTAQDQVVLIEHQQSANYNLYNSPQPKELTPEQYRFEVHVPAGAEAVLEVQERRMVSRREELRRQSLENLSQFVQQGILTENVYEQVAVLMRLWEKLADLDKELGTLDKEREKVYKAQQQIQGNMSALGTTGKEGNLRIRYVSELEKTEEGLMQLQERENSIQVEKQKIEAEIQARLKELG